MRSSTSERYRPHPLGACCPDDALDLAGHVVIPGPWADILSRNGTLSVPFLWEGTPYALDGTTLTMTWSYGAAVAVTAAFASLAAAVAALVITSAGAKARRADAVTGRSRPPAAQT